ncbi:hypothetical protein UFOVP723_151 [uncultured Caudovirales phage]|uniref:Uncharacterized protein n=1 Tax=uncultured Caudovirales phage TaxID=2100421 RepID=A0A6J5NN81_9CAUD|nr:hypothetical protein UFOVP723_151 [uncultured Caudovirales phage]
MKRIFSIVAIIISTSVFSQIYTVSASQVKMHITHGNVSYLDAIEFPDKIVDITYTNTLHVLNLSDSTCSYYYHGVYVNTVLIIKFENVNNVLHFVMEDHDVNGLPVRSNFIIDMNNNAVFYYWFNEIQRVTKVEIKTDFKVIVN